MKDNINLSTELAVKAWDEKKKQAKTTLKSDDLMIKFFDELERKLKKVPVAGTKLAAIPTLASLVYSYWKGEYTSVPSGSIIAILAALLYFVSPIDLIPDSIPGIGYVDDAAVISMCWAMVESDVEDYKKWRKSINKSKNH